MIKNSLSVNVMGNQENCSYASPSSRHGAVGSLNNRTACVPIATSWGGGGGQLLANDMQANKDRNTMAMEQSRQCGKPGHIRRQARRSAM